MKKIGLYSLLAISLLAEPAFAQKSKVTTAVISMRNKDLAKAKDAINEATLNEATKGDPDTWLYRGQIYRAIAEDPKLKDSEPNALQEAYTSFTKGISLDVKNKNSDLKDELKDLALVFYDKGSAQYNAQKYDKAFEYFDDYSTALAALDESRRKEITNLLVKNNINPLAVKLYTAYSAQKIGNKEKAKQYYDELAAAKYNDPFVYISLSDIYKAAGDTTAAVAALDKGLANVTDKKSILIDKLNIYITRGQTKEALQLGQDALKLDPENISLYIAMGNIYDNLKMTKEAEDMYNKALAKDPASFNTNYSLGISFFNQGADKYNASNSERDMKKSNALMDEAKASFKKAIPYLEKAHEVKQNDKEVLNVLAEIYAKTGDLDKSKIYRNKLKALK